MPSMPWPKSAGTLSDGHKKAGASGPGFGKRMTVRAPQAVRILRCLGSYFVFLPVSYEMTAMRTAIACW